MIDLVADAGGVALRCSDCDVAWPVDDVRPFMAQLRLVAVGHTCPGTGRQSRAGRATHLRLVTD